MAELVEQMSTRYPDRILVFDSPPLLATTEARVLASHMGQIIMVVEADATSQQTVLKALETIETLPGRADGAEQGVAHRRRRLLWVRLLRRHGL